MKFSTEGHSQSETNVLTLQEDLLPTEKQKKNDDLLPPVDANKFVYYNTKPVNSPHYTDSDNSEDEGLTDYKVNGYHPVHVGEIHLDRYVIMQKLGYGHFSTAWLA